MRKKYIFIYILSCLLLFTIKSIAQPQNIPIGGVTPPSAEAFAEGRLLETTANSLTGVVPVNIPLHVINSNKLSLPISLSYNASGVKVSDPASYVGMGWSLSAGGMISRSVVGVRDESQFGILKFTGTVFAGQIADGFHDAEPDVFTYSFAGKSGKFIIDRDINQIIQQPRTDMVIQPVSDDLNEFIIIDTDGTKYYFGDENTFEDYHGYATHFTSATGPILKPGKGRSRNSSTDNVRTEWYLKKIESYDQSSVIDLTYQNNHYGIYFPTSQEYGDYKILADGEVCVTNPQLPGIVYSCTVGGTDATGVIDNPGSLDAFFRASTGQDVYHTFSSYQSKIPLSINYNGTSSVTFELSGISRKDVSVVNFNDMDASPDANSLAYPLHKIIINESERTKIYQFQHDYFKSEADPQFSFDYRLKLLSITEFGGADTKPPYVFSYHRHPNFPSFDWLPSRLSKAIDKWGYMNEMESNNDLVFNIEPACVPVIFNDVTFTLGFGQADRSSSPDQHYGTLSQIKNPTGGRTEFDFESNEIWDPEASVSFQPGCTAAPILLPCSIATPDTCTTLTYDNASEGAEIFTTLQYNTELLNSYCLLYSKVICEGPPQLIGTNDCDRNGELYVIIEDPATGDVLADLRMPYQECEYSPGIFTAFQELFPGIPSSYLGQSIKLKLIGINAEAEIKFFKRITVGKNVPVGGIRVKSIKHYSAPGELAKSVSYSYGRANAPGESSLKILVPATMTHVHSGQTEGSIFGNDYYYYIRKFTSGSFFPLSDFDGNHIGYTRVIANVDNGGGYTIYSNSPQANQLDDIESTYPILPLDYFPGNFVPDSTSLFTSDNVLVQSSKTPMLTSFYKEAVDPYYRLQRYKSDIGVDHFFIASYKPVEKAAVNDKVVSTIHYSEGDVSVTTDYSYDNNQLLPTFETMTNSDGKAYVNLYTFPHQYSESTAIKDALVARNIIAPWKTLKIVNGQVVDGARTHWSFFNSSTGTDQGTSNGTDARIYPLSMERHEATWDENGIFQSGNWDLQYTFSSYDPVSGKPTSLLMNGWQDPVNYTWTNNGKMETTQFIGYETTYDYFQGDELISRIQNPDGTSASYDYDGLFRLTSIIDEQRNVSTDISYAYQVNNEAKNYVETAINYPTLGSQSGVQVRTRAFADGFGRPIQALRLNQAPDPGKHIVVNTEYDQIGRVSKVYEPFDVSGGSDGYVTSNTMDFTLTTYEDSPLNRKISETPPSFPTVFYEYGINTALDAVAYHQGSIDYGSGELSKQTMIDGNGNRTESFTDKRGRVVLSRRTDQNGGGANDTYTLYDDKERPTTIIPPGADLTTPGLLFTKTYYADDQIQFSKVPDQEKVEMRYDARDLLTHMQDGERRGEGSWYTMSLDNYGRSTAEGFNTSALADDHAGDVTVSNVLKQYTYGTSGISIDKMVQSSVKILDSTSDFITYNYTYTPEGLQKSMSSNHIEALDNDEAHVMMYNYDSQDNVLSEHCTVDFSPNIESFIQSRDFDHVGRLITERLQRMGEEEIILCDLTYDAKDLLKTKVVGDGLQTIDYSYSPNRLMMSINDPNSIGTDLFAQSFAYSTPHTGTSVTGRNNGDISSIQWATPNSNVKTFGYTYDHLNRLTSGIYHEMGRDNHYNTSYTYDARGNIQTIDRQSEGTAYDEMMLNYISGTNQLLSISGPAASTTSTAVTPPKSINQYDYDANGAMIQDPTRNVDIARNYLNLIDKIEKNDNNFIDYLHDAEGSLLQKITQEEGVDTTKRTYIGYLEYLDGELNLVKHSQGYIEKMPMEEAMDETTDTGSGDDCTMPEEYVSHWVLSDHLGNTRVVFDNDLNIVSEHHYYPFGLEMEGEWAVDNEYAYRYNNKEREQGFDLKYLNYGARFYDASIGRFTSVDPIGETMPFSSAYSYGFNNPIKYIDAFGLNPILLIWRTSRGYQGHTSLAIENFTLNDAGEYISDGTYSIYEVNATEEYTTEEFARDPGMSLDGSLTQVPGVFSRDEVLSFDQGNGQAEGVIEFDSTPEEDYNANELIQNDIGNVNYSLSEETAASNGSSCTYSCTSFVAKYGSALYPSISLDQSTENVTHGGIESRGIPPVNMNSFTPSSVYKSASKQGTVLRGYQKIFSLPFIDAYTAFGLRDTTPRK